MFYQIKEAQQWHCFQSTAGMIKMALPTSRP